MVRNPDIAGAGVEFDPPRERGHRSAMSFSLSAFLRPTPIFLRAGS
jgi:hypothetical protein